MLIEALRSEKRLLEILHDRLLESEHYETELFEEIESFTTEYLAFHKLSVADACSFYLDFIKSYNKDVRKFSKEGLFPLEIEPKRKGPARVEYNIILLFSCLFNPHRFRIMQLINQSQKQTDLALFVGCGPGLEIGLTHNQARRVIAYDLTLDRFLDHKFTEVDFRNSYFDGTQPEKFDAVYLIEILEHLSEPMQLMEACANVMNEGALLHLTTATNIPQFDHLYNFPVDHTSFDKEIVDSGFEVVFSEVVPHQAMTQGVSAQNKYYTLKKSATDVS